MKRNLPKYITEYTDRHGRLRRYFRYKKTRIPIPDPPGHPDFESYYKQLLVAYNLADASGSDAQKEGFVYFAKCGNFIKIGFSIQPEKRLSELQTGSGVPIEIVLSLPGTRGYERHLHRQFRSLRVNGEWFSADPRLLDHIETIKFLRQ